MNKHTAVEELSKQDHPAADAGKSESVGSTLPNPRSEAEEDLKAERVQEEELKAERVQEEEA
ncbi:MAG TPA: hypothetical protein VGX68_06625 [Thermoanaerobaculia bacterium]|jgi:hypothetical protein|nr:hypothetical protein [Thermoanaerobaculia bacterium]